MLSRLPSLVQMLVVEVVAVVCLGAGGFARLAGHPSSEPLSARVFAQLLLGLLAGWLLLRQICRPRLQQVSWSPVRQFGPVAVVLPNDPSATQTVVLSSHPSYVLLDLVAGLLPGFLAWASWGDDPALNPSAPLWRWSLAIWAVFPLARLLCWYGLGRGPDLLREIASGRTRAASQLGWELAWRPVLAFAVIATTVTLPGLALGVRDTRRTEAATPLLDATRVAEIRATPAAFRDARLRVRGRMLGAIQQWPAGGGKQASAGIRLQTADGAQVLVFCDVHRLREFERLVARGASVELTLLVRVLENGGREIGRHYSTYYGWNPADFGPAPSGGWMLTYFVDA
ncbi:MAG: hypothetical protein JSR82_03490 [Verrucomicrobia bacterium]|nr:hypothetical protein [Verrucomicrobiota bacterium]